MLQFEVFTSVPRPPETVWAVVGDLRSLPRWTDVEHVEDAPAAPPERGARFDTVTRDLRLSWVVLTSDTHLLEVKADDTPCGRLGLGVSVAPDGPGSRLVLAGLLDPSCSTLRARTVEVPRLRRRLDRWAARATATVTG